MRAFLREWPRWSPNGSNQVLAEKIGIATHDKQTAESGGMVMRGTMILVLAALLAVTAPAVAQAVSVTLDGQPVAFAGTQPMVVGGRVLVPLRGVLEQMGAFVGWDPATRTVIAQRSGINVELPVGSRTATVNGRQVALDVPARIVQGSTMVPLRFLSEALGADVAWNPGTRTVQIATGPGTGQPPGGVGAGPVEIASFTHNARGWLRAGSTVEVVMEGTPGGVAVFEIPGLADRVPMRETTPGRYVTRYTVPAGTDLTVSRANVIGQLRVGTTQRLIQAGVQVSVDTAGPRITNRNPEPNTAAALTRPIISATFDDAGSGIDPNSVEVAVNGRDVTQQATVTANFFTFSPAQPLPSGQNTVTVSVADRAGNVTTQSWTFRSRGTGDIITSFTHSNITNLQPGDVINVQMRGVSGGQATFSLVSPTGARLATVNMRETSPGVYTGDYTVRRGQDISGAFIVGNLTLTTGEVYTTTSQDTVGTQPGALASPRITSPTTAGAVTSPMTITGTAPPNSRVALRVEYRANILDLFETTGVLSEQTVDVGAAGTFRSQPINLTTLVRGRDTRYTITATTVGPGGERSEPTVVSVSGS